jgi:hypothetical protein
MNMQSIPISWVCSLFIIYFSFYFDNSGHNDESCRNAGGYSFKVPCEQDTFVLDISTK